ncbi:glycosyltransferase [Patescibacteria group bacterium]|nr:glycosyltransferase [Patescibacteria group bacterium]MCL5091384.1 glycosyltransferase [Patescibacteria group bacterium]
MRPFFSVIVPTLNEARYLPRLLNDLSKQSESDFETVIVDARSTDQTVERARGYVKLQLRLFQMKKRQVASQRNYGAFKARGRYLVFLDADSRIKPNFLLRLKQVIRRRPALLYIPKIRSKDKALPHINLLINLSNLIVELSQFTPRPFSTGGNMIWEKQFFRLIGGFDDRLFLSEDHNIISQANAWGVRAQFVSRISINVSLRRFKNEGQLVLFYKYMVAAAHVLLKKKMDKRLFRYEMGGGQYREKTNHQLSRLIQLRRYLKQVEKTIKDLVVVDING